MKIIRKRKNAEITFDLLLRLPCSMAADAVEYLRWLEVRNYSAATVHNRKNYLTYFIRWAMDHGLHDACEITRPILERYQRFLFLYRKKLNNQPLSARSQHTQLLPIKAFFQWLTRQNLILSNPAADLELPRMEKKLPQSVLTAPEAEQVINLADVHDPLGLRDRCLMEVLYSTGIRRKELVNLSIYDLDPSRGILMIRQGKGKKDRVVPIGERAVAWLERYVQEVRPQLCTNQSERVLFLTGSGEPISCMRASEIVREYINRANLGKKGSCHIFRHTCATLMLENGADIRYIQQMLGHAELSTTEIYTHVAIHKLKEIHTATHPAKLRKEPETAKENPSL